MKKATLLFSLALSMLFVLNSCTKEDTDDRDAFVGSWNISETYTITGWGTDTDNYTISITKSTTADNIITISTFAGISTFIVDATVTGNSFTISDTIIDEGDTYNVSGNGSINGSSMTMTYNIGGFWTGSCTGSKVQY